MRTQKTYNSQWGIGVYKDLCNTYARATWISTEILGIGFTVPARWVCTDQSKWEKFKKLVKAVEKVDIQANRPKLDKHMISSYAEKAQNFLDY